VLELEQDLCCSTSILASSILTVHVQAVYGDRLSVHSPGTYAVLYRWNA
jgi:hypothetical protein